MSQPLIKLLAIQLALFSFMSSQAVFGHNKKAPSPPTASPEMEAFCARSVGGLADKNLGKLPPVEAANLFNEYYRYAPKALAPVKPSDALTRATPRGQLEAMLSDLLQYNRLQPSFYEALDEVAKQRLAIAGKAYGASTGAVAIKSKAVGHRQFPQPAIAILAKWDTSMKAAFASALRGTPPPTYAPAKTPEKHATNLGYFVQYLNAFANEYLSTEAARTGAAELIPLSDLHEPLIRLANFSQTHPEVWDALNGNAKNYLEPLREAQTQKAQQTAVKTEAMTTGAAEGTAREYLDFLAGVRTKEGGSRLPETALTTGAGDKEKALRLKLQAAATNPAFRRKLKDDKAATFLIDTLSLETEIRATLEKAPTQWRDRDISNKIAGLMPLLEKFADLRETNGMTKAKIFYGDVFRILFMIQKNESLQELVVQSPKIQALLEKMPKN